MQNKFKWLIPSIADVIFSICFLVLALWIPETLLMDCDTGYHIRIGEYILDKLSVPQYDFLSAAASPIEYIDFEWLSQVIMAFIHKMGGLTGIVIFFSFLISLIFYLEYKIVRRETGHPVAVIAITLLVLASASAVFMARPHIFSMLMFLLWYFILDLYQYRNRNYLYVLPVLMFFWINLHGAFILGFILTGSYMLGNLLKALFSKGSEQSTYRKKTGLFFLIILVAFILSLLNPYGLKGLLHPITALLDNFMVHHISEFASPNFHHVGMIPFAIFLLVMMAVFAFSRKSINAIEFFLMIVFTYFALYSMRNIPFLVIVMAPILARHIDKILSESNGKAGKIFNRYLAQWDSLSRGGIWLILPVIPVVCLALNGNIRYSFDANIKPVAAVEFLKIENIPGNMYNGYEFGDYIIYSAYPRYKVFIDGRADMYGDRFKDYFKIDRLEPGWESLLEKYKVNFIIFNADAILSKFLLTDSRWHLIYSDKLANIFVKNIPRNNDLIQKYKNVTPFVADDYDETF